MKTMKPLFAVLFFAIVGTLYGGAPKSGAAFTFEKKYHDFGTIKAGEKVSTTFVFTNSGTAPLIISDIITPCGCTVPEWPKEPILPGEKKEIKVEFNSAGKDGILRKALRIISNASGDNVLQIKVNVVRG